MGTPAQVAQVFHNVPKPISVLEFRDALDAICRPRFPMAIWGRPRAPAIAVSGGVDSMALAFLFSQLQLSQPRYKLADNPIGRPHGIVIDHGLRKGSDVESEQVYRQLMKMGLHGVRFSMRWKTLRYVTGIEPADLPNIESVARTRRYQQFGAAARLDSFTSLFLAHHADDQYETVLMRLLSGHGYRGLQGMSPANDVPECFGQHYAHKSGLLDDQKRPHTFLNFFPSLKTMRVLQCSLRNEILGQEDQPASTLAAKPVDAAPLHGNVPQAARLPGTPYLAPLQCEDGGLFVYRPLLEFDKARLIATCEANNVPWFEDGTNSDSTLTMRNAVRHMVAHHTLPAALQKPAILALARRSRRRVELEEAEASRLLIREAIIREFDPCAGTLIVQLPTLHPPRRPRNRTYDGPRVEARKPHQKLIAALAIRKIMEVVSPNDNMPPVGNLDNAVLRLFPELDPAKAVTPPTSFSIGGVLFDPIRGSSPSKWFISRAPYPSNQPVPDVNVDWRECMGRRRGDKAFDHDPNWSGWRKMQTPKLWDGRYWIQIHSQLESRIHVRPFSIEHAKPFRDALTHDQRDRLGAILKHYAPGKVRYTLPGIYIGETDGDAMGAPVKRYTLVALPSLNIHLPGLGKRLKYEVSYKRIDLSLLGRRRRGARRWLIGFEDACSQSRRVRRKRQQASGQRRQTTPGRARRPAGRTAGRIAGLVYSARRGV